MTCTARTGTRYDDTFGLLVVHDVNSPFHNQTVADALMAALSHYDTHLNGQGGNAAELYILESNINNMKNKVSKKY